MRSLFVSSTVAALLFAFALAGRAQTIDREALTMLTELVTVELSKDRRLAVLSSTDVREVVALEAEKQAMGCESSASCLAEVAGAMGARFVVFGQLGRVGSVYLLSLHIIDSDEAAAAGRVVLKGDSLESLVAQVDDAVERLVGSAVEGKAESAPLRVLVLDFKPASGESVSASASAPAPEGPGPLPAPEEAGSVPWLLLGGVAGAGLGAAVVASGGAFAVLGQGAYQEAKDAPVQVDAARLLDDANAWALAANIALLAGGAALVAGAGVAALGVFLGDES